jgi:hypothetical protein
MVNSSKGLDVGMVPDKLMRSNLRIDGGGGSLVRTTRASGDIQLLRIVLNGREVNAFLL